MIRTLVWFTFMWTSLLALVPLYYKGVRLTRQGRQAEADAFVFKVAGEWARQLVGLAGGKVAVKTLALLPEKPYLIVANHQGNFDIPIILGYVSSQVGFLSKVENGKLPFVGGWMRLLHCVFIERGNPREAVKAIQMGVDTLNQGYNLVLFPEGTRSPDGGLQPFKSGSLKLASKANVTIVPVIIDGSFRMMKKGSLLIQPANIQVTIGQHFEPSAYESTNQLSDGLERYFKEIMEAEALLQTQ